MANYDEDSKDIYTQLDTAKREIAELKESIAAMKGRWEVEIEEIERTNKELSSLLYSIPKDIQADISVIKTKITVATAVVTTVFTVVVELILTGTLKLG